MEGLVIMLQKHEIAYQLEKHEEVFTIEAMMQQKDWIIFIDNKNFLTVLKFSKLKVLIILNAIKIFFI